jgi:hypothetical protein
MASQCRYRILTIPKLREQHIVHRASTGLRRVVNRSQLQQQRKTPAVQIFVKIMSACVSKMGWWSEEKPERDHVRGRAGEKALHERKIPAHMHYPARSVVEHQHDVVALARAEHDETAVHEHLRLEPCLLALHAPVVQVQPARREDPLRSRCGPSAPRRHQESRTHRQSRRAGASSRGGRAACRAPPRATRARAVGPSRARPARPPF